MFEADFTRTERRAQIDDGSGRSEFARRFLRRAKEHGDETVVWQFATKRSVGHLDRDAELGGIAAALRRRGRVTISGVTVMLATKRLGPTPPVGTFALPLAVWWPDDDQLLRVDSTHRPLLDAFVSDGTRAPIWLTAFEIEIGEPVGVRDPDSGLAGDAVRSIPVAVDDELQEIVARASGGMTLSTNGIHDSLGDRFLRDVRPLVRGGQSTPEAVAVAALRAGWWPEKIPALLDKL